MKFRALSVLMLCAALLAGLPAWAAGDQVFHPKKGPAVRFKMLDGWADGAKENSAGDARTYLRSQEPGVSLELSVRPSGINEEKLGAFSSAASHFPRRGVIEAFLDSGTDGSRMVVNVFSPHAWYRASLIVQGPKKSINALRPDILAMAESLYFE